MHSSLHSSNPVVRMLAHMAVQGSGSVMSRNCNLLQQVYNINSYDVVNGGCSLFNPLIALWPYGYRPFQHPSQ